MLTLDVEIPKMDGIDFLGKLMRLRPMSVVMVSTLTERGSEITFRALELEAVDFVAKPKIDIASGMQEYSNEIVDKIRAAMAAKIRQHVPIAVAPKNSADVVLPAVANRVASTEKLIIGGASTGGTEAIKDFMIQLPPVCWKCTRRGHTTFLCVVSGMPKEAILQGVVDEIVLLPDMARQVLLRVSSMGKHSHRV